MLQSWVDNDKEIDRYESRDFPNLPDIDDDYLIILQGLGNQMGCDEDLDDPHHMMFMKSLVNCEKSYGFLSTKDGTSNFIKYGGLSESGSGRGITKEEARRVVVGEGKRVDDADLEDNLNSSRSEENREGKIQENDNDLEVEGEKRTDENRDDENQDGESGANVEGSMTLTKNVSPKPRGRKKGSVMKRDGDHLEKRGKRRAHHSPTSRNRKKRCLTKKQNNVHDKETKCLTRKPKYNHGSAEMDTDLIRHYLGEGNILKRDTSSSGNCYESYLNNSSVVEGDAIRFAYKGRKYKCSDNNVDASSDSEVEILEKAPNCTERKYMPVADSEVLHAPMEEDELRCIGECRETENPQFREEIERLLREPFNQKEYESLWFEVNSRKLMEGRKELRGGHIKTYPKERTGKSYLDHYFDLQGPLHAFQDDLPRQLNVLRGFFYYLKRMSVDGAFKPWLDKSCLSIAPGTE